MSTYKGNGSPISSPSKEMMAYLKSGYARSKALAKKSGKALYEKKYIETNKRKHEEHKSGMAEFRNKYMK